MCSWTRSIVQGDAGALAPGDLRRGIALAEGVGIERESDARSDAAPIWRTIMKKLATLVPVALLAGLAGCNGPTANLASEDLGEAAQAITVAGSWSGLPVTGNAQWAVCSATSGGVSHEFQLKLDAVQPGSVDVSRVGALAAQVVADAIVRAARQATSIPGYPAARDLR